MNSNLRKWAVIILLGLILGSFIYSIIENKNAKNALKINDSVVAVVTKKVPGRSNTCIYVDYTYRGVLMHCEFQAEPDSFEMNDKVLLKISKQYPEKYISVVRIIK